MLVRLYLLFEILSILICLSRLYGRKFKLDFPTVIVISLDIIMVYAINYLNINHIVTMIIYPILWIYCFVEFGADIRALVINNLLCMIILGVLQLASALLCLPVYRIINDDTLITVIINILVLTVTAVFLRKLKVERISFYLRKKELLVWVEIIVIAVVVIYCYAYYKCNGGIYLVCAVIIFICVVTICVLIGSWEKYKIKAIEAETELRMYELYERSYENLVMQIRIRQHNFDDHINAIYSQHLIYKTYDELVRVQDEYIQCIKTDNRYNKLLQAGNTVLIGFLYGKFLEMEKQGIEISYKVNIGHLECGIPTYKIIDMLGNLLNNAADALMKNGYGKLSVALLEYEKEIVIEVMNRNDVIEPDMAVRMFDKNYSSKGEGRGIGLYKLNRMCQEYNILIEFSNEELEDGNWISFKLIIEK